MIIIKSTQSPNSIDGSPFDDFGFNYLWRLHGLGHSMPAFRGMTIIKNGFAKYCRAGGFNGVESRIIETLRGIEESLDVPRGTMRGEIIALTTGTFDETLSSEQYFHKQNKAWRLAGLFRDLTATGQKPVGGHSEFCNLPEKLAKAKFAKAHLKANLAKGFQTVSWKRHAGIHGCPTPLENPEEIGYAL